MNAPLARYTRFGLGGPARLLVDAASPDAFIQVHRLVSASSEPWTLLGGGTNLIVSDAGFDGIVVRFTGQTVEREGNTIRVEAGAVLQHLVDFAIAEGLGGIETMTGIPGWVGAAVYGNAGAYGQSIAERLTDAVYFDGSRTEVLDNAGCGFTYRASGFKKHKERAVLSARFAMLPADRVALREKAEGILTVRNAKYPPTMKCAGSIFKNLLFADLTEKARAAVPPSLVRDGKVPSAFFLEQAGGKGMVQGGMEVARYHANLIFNTGTGTARDVCQLIDLLKGRVRERFAVELEEEVQYVGLADRRSY